MNLGCYFQDHADGFSERPVVLMIVYARGDLLYEPVKFFGGDNLVQSWITFFQSVDIDQEVLLYLCAGKGVDRFDLGGWNEGSFQSEGGHRIGRFTAAADGKIYRRLSDGTVTVSHSSDGFALSNLLSCFERPFPR